MSLPDFTDKPTLDAAIITNVDDNFVGGITAQDVRTVLQMISDSFTHQARPVQLTDAANISWDLDDGLVAGVTLGGNRTMDAPSNPRAGQRITLQVIQDGTGSRTLTWNSFFVWPAETPPTLSTGTNRMDIFTFIIVDNGVGSLLAAQESEIIGVYTSTGGSGGGPWAPLPE